MTNLDKLELLLEFKKEYNFVVGNDLSIENKIDLLLNGIALLAQIIESELVEKTIDSEA